MKHVSAMSTVTPFTHVNEFIDLLRTTKSTFCAADESTFPVVSVISSFFNAHQYFEATYQSVINQTFQNFEWLIVDDGSTDPVAISLVQSLSTRSRKIKTLKHDFNQGPSAGRNTAIAQAKGAYLFFIDLDDLIDPTYIEKCVLFLESHPEFSFVNSYSVGFQAQAYWWAHGFNQLPQFIHQNWVTGRLLYRKSDFDLLGGFDEDLRVYEDWERWLRAIVNGQKGWTLPEYLDCYRRCDSGLLATSRENLLEEKRITRLIKTRYQDSFEKKSFNHSEVRRNSFDVHQLQFKFAITNLLKRETAKQHILCFFPHLEVGGADRFNLDLITLLTKRGYKFTIATTLKSDHPWNQHFYAITPDIFHLPNFLNEYHWLAFARYMLESRQIDLVFISNCYISYYFLPILRKEFPRIAFVDLTHTIDPGWRGTGYPRLSCQFSQFLDCQVVTSQSLAKTYQNTKFIDSTKLRVCYTNIGADLWVHSPPKRQSLRSTLNISDDTIVLLFPSRIVEQKRPLFLVDIVQSLVKHHSSILVIAIGSGELLPAMQTKIHQLSLEPYFHLLPAVEPFEMLSYYSAADILLLPSAYEGVSLAIYEAMAMQLPVVASDVGGQAELVIPETGFLVAKGNGDGQEVQAYVQVLLPLIQNQPLRQAVGESARQRIVESFSLTHMADQIETIFQAAITSRQISSSFEVNQAIAEETLLMALEYLHQEQAITQLWQEKCGLEKVKLQLEEEKHELTWKKRAMESSKFWQLRQQWFKLKRLLRLTQEEEI